MFTPRSSSSSGTPSVRGLGGDALVRPRRCSRRALRAPRRRPPRAGHPAPRPGTASRGTVRAARAATWASPRSSSPSIVTEPRGHLVVAAAHQRVRERRLARSRSGPSARAPRRCAPRGRRRAGSRAAATVACRSAMRSTCSSVDASRQHHRDVVAVDLDRRTPGRAASPAASAAHRSSARTSSRASGTRSRARPPTRRLRRASSRRASTRRRARRSRRRCARARCGGRRRRSGRAVPGARSSRAHRRTSIPITPRPRVFELVDDRPPQAARERADREPLEHVVEESEHDQALRLFGRDAARLEVVELLVVDRSDGRRVRAADVVRLDLEVRDRLRARAFGEHEVAVRLRRVRLLRGRAQAHEARVHRAGRVLDRALEQAGRCACWARRGPAACGSRASARRRRSRPRAGRSRAPWPVEQRLAAQARVVAAERDRRRAQASRRARRARAAVRGATCASRAPAP